MRRTSALLLATAALAMSAAPPALAKAMPTLPPPPPPRPRDRMRSPVYQPETPGQALRREIADHNTAVAARRAEKLARRAANRKG